MVRYPLIIKNRIWALAYDQIKTMKQMSMGKYLNMLIDEAVLKREKNKDLTLKMLDEKCFLCGRKAGFYVIAYTPIVMCELHFRFFRRNYESYITTWKELKK